jgi:hypothetical protein
MNIFRRYRFVPMLGVLLASGLATPPEAFAQSRPFRGLFGSERPNPNSDQSLSMMASVYGGYDDNATASQNFQADPRIQPSSTLAGADVSLGYTRQAGRRFSLSAGVATAVRYYPDLDELTGGTYQGNVAASWQLTRRTTLVASQSVIYAPYYSVGLFPSLDDPVAGQPVLPSLDYTLLKQPSWQLATTASISRQLGRKSAISAFYERGQTLFESVNEEVVTPTPPPLAPDPIEPEPDLQRSLDFLTQGAGFAFTRRIGRYATLRLGYTYREGTYAVSDLNDSTSHDIDVGVDYSRSLSLSRRAILSFSTGTSVIQTADDTFTRVNGAARLDVALSRRWDTSIAYDRGLYYINGLTAPVWGDSLSAQLQGTVSSRLVVSADAGYSAGEVGLTFSQGNYRTYSAGTNAQYALSRFIAAEAAYYYYYYDFDGNPLALVGAVSQLDRHGFHAGLTFFLPILR